MDLLNVIIKPLNSEKSYGLRMLEPKKYVFEVNRKASKIEIALAFKMIYGFMPEKVNVVNRKPVAIRTGTRNPGMSKFKRIAYITIPAGYDIAVDEESAKSESK